MTKTRGKSYEELRWGGSKYDTINQGCFEATARVKEMQEDGVQLEVIYPPQRTMRHFMLDEDKEFHLAGVQAFQKRRRVRHGTSSGEMLPETKLIAKCPPITRRDT